MASETALFESAQAIFCAIADLVGAATIDTVLNHNTYKTYEDFISGQNSLTKKVNKTVAKKHQTLIAQARKIVNVDAPWDGPGGIEHFLDTKVLWYKSSVSIAKSLITELHKIKDLNKFRSIVGEGFDEMYYMRGDSAVMDKFGELYKIANANTEYNTKIMKVSKFGDINKWNPADIYFASTKAITDINTHLTEANKDKKNYSFNLLNQFVEGLLAQGQLLPLSLKKQPDKVTIKKINFYEDVKSKLIDGKYLTGNANKGGNVDGGLWHMASNTRKTSGVKKIDVEDEDDDTPGGWSDWVKHPKIKRKGNKFVMDGGIGEPFNADARSTATTRDLKILVSDNKSRSQRAGRIQLRHEVSAMRGSWKVDFKYYLAGARGGSVVSEEIFAELLSFVDPSIATTFKNKYNTGANEYAKIHQDLTPQKNAIMAKWQKDKGNNKTLFTGKKPTPWDSLRGEASARTVTNKVMPILQKWLQANSDNGTTGKPNKVDNFVRILFRYVTSRAETSARFVIAK